MNAVIVAWKSSSVRGRSRYTADFTAPHKQNSGGFRSGKRGGHTYFKIMRSPKNSFNECKDLPDVWAVALSC